MVSQRLCYGSGSGFNWALDPDKERQKMSNKKDKKKMKIWIFFPEKIMEASPEAWKSFGEV
jgi:hypothetical protein